jgi:hypothetical protein
VRRVDGVLLQGDEIAVAAVLARIAVAYLQRRNGTAPAAARQLAADLTTAARGTASALVSTERGIDQAPAAVTVTGWPPTQTVRAAAAQLGLKERRVRGLCQDGHLIATRSPAGHWQIDAASVAAEAARRKGA